MNQQVENYEPELSADDVAETKAWEALEADVGGEGGGEPEPTADEPAGDPGPVAADKAAGDNGGEAESGKPSPEQLAEQYQAAMREERTRRQALESQIHQINQAISEARNGNAEQFDAAPPSIDEDPVAYFEHQQKILAQQIEETRHEQTQDRQSRAQQQQYQQFMGAVQSSEEQFAASTPDYFEAADHLRDLRMNQLASVYPDGPAGDAYANQMGYQDARSLRSAHLEQEVSMYANSAFQTGQNPAEVFYNLARSSGWAPKAQQTTTPESKIKMARAATERSQSLSGGSGSGGNDGNASIAELNELFLSDPDAADKLFDKLAGQGALG